MDRENAAIAIYNALTVQLVTVGPDGSTSGKWLTRPRVQETLLNTGLGGEIKNNYVIKTGDAKNSVIDIGDRIGEKGTAYFSDFGSLVIFKPEEKDTQALAIPPAPTTVNPTASTVYVNGEQKSFEAYLINESNYFKLRDLAYVLNGTNKQFEVGYDNSTKAITLTSGQPYTQVGGEMVAGDGKPKPATITPSKIYIDGKELSVTVYIIGGNNFFMLRDLMGALDIAVTYDAKTKNIGIDTSKGYTT
jgi:hypothetical protein